MREAMAENQRTIRQSTSISGVGLHTGEPVNMTFHPAPANHGFVFQRSDLPQTPQIKADVDHVVDTQRGTTIGIKGANVHTVEHTLAALVGLQVDNVLIELDGPEPPAMDGSSKDFVRALREAGFEEQDAVRTYFEIDEPIHYQDQTKGVELAILPGQEFQATVMVDFGSSILKAQHANLSAIQQFPEQFSDSRTFCFLHEVAALHKAGLIRGGNLDTAVVFVEEELDEGGLNAVRDLFQNSDIGIKQGVLNEGGLRYDNEPARHKLLDVIGDLALVGTSLKGHIIASRPGHKANVELARKIKNRIIQHQISGKFQKEGKQGMVFDINGIQEILPHRYPFLLVDRILEFGANSIKGIKNVTMNEPFFQGHFPGNPIMPGVLQLEAMAQIGGILLLNTIDNPQTVWVYIVGIDNARFKKPVIPGDTLVFELEMTALKRSICKMTGKAFVDGQLVCSADLVASVVPKTSI